MLAIPTSTLCILCLHMSMSGVELTRDFCLRLPRRHALREEANEEADEAGCSKLNPVSKAISSWDPQTISCDEYHTHSQLNR